MRLLRRISTALLVLLIPFVTLAKPVTNPGEIPVTDFFKTTEFTSLQLSPNGQFIAVLSSINDRRNIVVMDTKNLGNMKALTSLKKQDIAGYFWASNDELVFTLDSDGNEAFSLFKVSRKGKSKIVQLVGSTAGASGIRSAQVVHTLPDDPKHIMVQFNGRRVASPDIYKLALDSQWNKFKNKNYKMKLVARNPGNVQGWILDHDGEVRGAISLNGLKAEFHYKDKGEKKFRVIRTFNVHDEGISPLAFDYDNKTMFVSSNIGRDRGAIYRFDPNTNTLGDMVFEHDLVDVAGLMMSSHRKKLIGVSYLNDYPETVYFDASEANIVKGLKGAFPGKEVNIVSMSKNEELNVLLVSNDQDPGAYYLYNRATGKVRFLVARMKWIKEKLMSPMKPIEFKSRDDLTIRGYLTVPKHSDGKMLPLIVNPHGGPFGIRDSWGFNPEHQFFASRGYATVQVNYRGSGGYGRKFYQAGFGGKWGAEMQNDLTDAVHYLVKKGIVDPEKVCIYGSSYGGYATMAGLTFTPDLYKCGINYVGVTDVALLFESMPKHWEPAKEKMKIEIGDPDDDALMKRMSPLYHIDKIKAPLMIVHGSRDPRVVKKHATLLRDALEKRGIILTDDEWIMKKNEGHGFRKEENKFELYTKMEKFLAKYL